ncbi:MAG TPA: Flp family type IVb pilin [Novosphingobium sp.]|nr:Flp family type IVb pilin [Novosphingobium sp.]HMP55342.1 Flp family type IVb pilin [Novosphingobium sp.]
MKKLLAAFLSDESGASAAEYALILAIVGVALGGAALALSLQIQGSITDAAQDIKDCRDGSANCQPAALK